MANKAEQGKEAVRKLKEKQLPVTDITTQRDKKSTIKLKEKTLPTTTNITTGRGKESATKLKEEMTKKNGLHHTVFSVDKYSINEYTGEWVNDKKHGYGTQVWSKTGSMYMGYWKNGKPDGKGIQKVLDPKLKSYVVKYAGEWKNGKKHGMGLYFDNSTVYEGHWVEGHQNGWGRMYYQNGNVYAGEWLNDQRHGHGLMSYNNQNIHIGEWRDGMKNGKGSSYCHRKKLYFEGIWLNGSPTSQQQLTASEFETRNQGLRASIELLKAWNPAVEMSKSAVPPSPKHRLSKDVSF